MKSIILLFVAVLILGPPSEASSDRGESIFPTPKLVELRENEKPHVAFIMGISDPDETFDATGEFGVEVGLQPIIPFGIRAELSYLEYNGSGRIEPSYSRLQAIGTATYNFGGQTPIINTSYAGLGLAALYENPGGNEELAVGLVPVVGFDYFFEKNSVSMASVGLSVRRMIASGESPDATTLNAILKYWY